MALTPRPVSGSKFYVSTATPATIDAAGYAALTKTEVPGLGTIPGFGDSYNEGTFDSVSDGQYKYRGLRVGPSFQTTILDAPADPGQVILKAAFDAAPGTAAEKLSFWRLDASGIGQAAQGFILDFSPADGGAGDLQMRDVSISIIVNTTVEIAP
jgi:hypothetical protein